MRGREFLKSARDLLAVGGEPNWRTALGRAYYALVHEGADALLRWGFPKPPGEQIHRFVRLRFDSTPHFDFRPIGLALDQLGRRRNEADYQLGNPGVFANDVVAVRAIRDATAAIAHLDAIEADSVRLAAALAALRKAWP